MLALFILLLVRHSLALIDIQASTVEPLVGNRIPVRFPDSLLRASGLGDLTSRIQTKIQILLIRFIVLGARSWGCRENARFFSWNKICWDEGSCEAGLCLPGDFCGWCCPGPRSILWETMFNQFMQDLYLCLNLNFVFKLKLKFMQDLNWCLNLNDLQLQSSGSSYGDGGFRSFQRRPGFKADSKSNQVGSSPWLLRQKFFT